MSQKPIPDSYPSKYYTLANEICYLKDIKGHSAQQPTQSFNCDRQQTGPSIAGETFTSIAEKLYKKIVKQGYIQKAKQFAIPQTRKKVENMYDLSDKWIDDEEVFTEPQTEKSSSSQFSQYRAFSGMSIEDFYEGRIKKSPSKFQVKNDKLKTLNVKPNLVQLLRSSQLTVVKYDELKKKIQSSMKSTSPSKGTQPAKN